MITHLLPVHYDPAAQAPRFEAFMERFQPDASTRRAVQISVGAGLLGVVVQKFFFHYGAGANGKSIFLELMARVLGQMAIILPTESIVGQQSGTGANASPDIARLYGKRFVRITELAEGEDLKEALVKKLTGGERIAARALFKGFFEFLPICKPHGSGNGYPRITGTDNGIWRRMTVFHWPVTLHEDEQREFEVVLSEFAPEYPGILNWLIRGAELFLIEGFKAPKAVKEETAKYREEMDPISGFVATCLTRDDAINLATGKHAARVQARDMYHGYCRWAAGNGRKGIHETRFGKLMDKHFYKDPKERVRHYYGVRMDLDGLPELPDLSRSPNDDG
jgi:putative DNA primase/helicase